MSYLVLRSYKNAVVISSPEGTREVFRTREKLDSFIDAIVEARDSTFPQ
jgi:hypothetical protein